MAGSLDVKNGFTLAALEVCCVLTTRRQYVVFASIDHGDDISVRKDASNIFRKDFKTTLFSCRNWTRTLDTPLSDADILSERQWVITLILQQRKIQNSEDKIQQGRFLLFSCNRFWTEQQ